MILYFMSYYSDKNFKEPSIEFMQWMSFFLHLTKLWYFEWRNHHTSTCKKYGSNSFIPAHFSLLTKGLSQLCFKTSFYLDSNVWWKLVWYWHESNAVLHLSMNQQLNENAVHLLIGFKGQSGFKLKELMLIT